LPAKSLETNDALIWPFHTARELQGLRDPELMKRLLLLSLSLIQQQPQKK